MKIIKGKKIASQVLSVRVSTEVLEVLDEKIENANEKLLKKYKDESVSKIKRSEIISEILESTILEKGFKIEV